MTKFMYPSHPLMTFAIMPMLILSQCSILISTFMGCVPMDPTLRDLTKYREGVHLVFEMNT